MTSWNWDGRTKIAVAGGAGLIGSLVTAQAKERGHDVSVPAGAQGVATRDERIAGPADESQAKDAVPESTLEDKALVERALAHAKSSRAMVALEVDGDEVGSTDYEDEAFALYGEVQVVKLGAVGVDSGQLMITDPCYIDSGWREVAFVDVRILDDLESGRSFDFRKDFNKHSKVLRDCDCIVNELIEDRALVQKPSAQPDAFAYTSRGAATALLTEGRGELVYRGVHVGDGLALATANGDGMYPACGKIRDGQIARDYVDVSENICSRPASISRMPCQGSCPCDAIPKAHLHCFFTQGDRPFCGSKPVPPKTVKSLS